jgi:hypothetical protein
MAVTSFTPLIHRIYRANLASESHNTKQSNHHCRHDKAITTHSNWIIAGTTVVDCSCCLRRLLGNKLVAFPYTGVRMAARAHWSTPAPPATTSLSTWHSWQPLAMVSLLCSTWQATVTRQMVVAQALAVTSSGARVVASRSCSPLVAVQAATTFSQSRMPRCCDILMEQFIRGSVIFVPPWVMRSLMA